MGVGKQNTAREMPKTSLIKNGDISKTRRREDGKVSVEKNAMENVY